MSTYVDVVVVANLDLGLIVFKYCIGLETRLVTFLYQVSKEEVVFHDGKNGAKVRHTDRKLWRDWYLEL